MPSVVGGPLDTLRAALAHLNSDSFQFVTKSSFYKTPCFPKGAGPDYVNAVAGFHTRLGPSAVLDLLHEVEAEFGRQREQRWGMRTLDLDLLAYGDDVVPDLDSYKIWQELPLELQKTKAPEHLILPHPRLHERAFVLVPFREIAPDWRHPVLGKTITELCDALPEEEISEVVAL